MVTLPPTSSDEPGFEGLHTDEAIQRQLLAIAHAKHRDVRQQAACSLDATVITADTTIVVGPSGQRLSLGQPPDDETYAEVLRHWFREHYFARWHEAWTGVVVSGPDGEIQEAVARSRIRMIERDDELLEWYIATREPLGKAGGYALQSLGSTFIAAVEGSLSNVVGLPLEALRPLLAKACGQAGNSLSSCE